MREVGSGMYEYEYAPTNLLYSYVSDTYSNVGNKYMMGADLLMIQANN